MPRSERRRIAFASCVVLLLVTFLIIRIGPAWLSWRRTVLFNTAASLELLVAELSRVEQLPEILDSTEVRIARIRNLEPVLLVDNDGPGGTAQLVSLVTALASQHSVHLESISPMADSGAGAAIRPITVKLQATTDVLGLHQFVAAVERARGPLSIRRLSARPLDIHVADTQPELIRISLELDALLLIRSMPDSTP